MKLVIDTSIIIDKLRGGPKWDLFLEEISGKEVELYLPSIVAFEIFSGKSTKKITVSKKVTTFLEMFIKKDLTIPIAVRAGKIYRDTGLVLAIPDYIIAATALEMGGEVVTLNTKHFQKIPGVAVFEY